MKRTGWLIALLGVLALSAVLLAACSGGGDGADGAGNGDDGATVNEIDQDNLTFKPARLTVKLGEEVTFKNSETAVHTVNINGKNESGTMKKGDVLNWTPPAVGDYKITCDFHPQMKATVTVTK